MAVNDIGVNVHTLPLVTVGVGFGIDYGLYIVSRIIEEIRVRGDLEDSVREALVTSGKAVTFTAVTMIISTLFWITSNIRFNAEMGLLLAIWMGISYVGSQTLLPVLILSFKPNFIMREACPFRAAQARARLRGAEENSWNSDFWNSIIIVTVFSFVFVASGRVRGQAVAREELGTASRRR